MANCTKCGTQYEDGAKFCPSCGAPSGAPAAASNAKLYCILAYITPLWLIGLLVKPDNENPQVRFHVNQGILVTLLYVALGIISTILAVPLFFLFWLWPILYILVAVINILGLINAIQGNDKRLPIIGNIDIIK